MGERLKAGAEPRLGAPHSLGDGADSPVLPAQQGDDAVRLAQILRPQHDPVIPVPLHLLILPHPAYHTGTATPRGRRGQDTVLVLWLTAPALLGRWATAPIRERSARGPG